MKPGSNNLEKILLKRLADKGIEPSLIPGFLKDLANSFFVDPDISLQQARQRLVYLGWNDIDLDYHTFQMAKECLGKVVDRLKDFEGAI